MPAQNSRRKGTIWVMILCVIGFYMLIVCPNLFLRIPAKNKLAEVNAPAKTIYKTIYSTDDSNSLIGFELHSSIQLCGHESHKECSVIVKSMDPKSDDYKTYCKDIVNDIVEMYGNKNITVNIYDSFEAYSLVVDESKLLSKKEEEFINEHRIAEFDSGSDYEGDRYAYLTYYPRANNEFYERVDYGSIVSQ